MFKLELSEFEWVKGRSRLGGRMLRFTVSWCYTGDYGGKRVEVGETQEGNLANLDSKGRLVWSPPMSRVGDFAKKHLFKTTPDLYNLVRDALLRSSYYDKMVEDYQTILAERDATADEGAEKVIEV